MNDQEKNLKKFMRLEKHMKKFYSLPIYIIILLFLFINSMIILKSLNINSIFIENILSFIYSIKLDFISNVIAILSVIPFILWRHKMIKLGFQRDNNKDLIELSYEQIKSELRINRFYLIGIILIFIRYTYNKV